MPFEVFKRPSPYAEQRRLAKAVLRAQTAESTQTEGTAIDSAHVATDGIYEPANTTSTAAYHHE